MAPSYKSFFLQLSVFSIFTIAVLLLWQYFAAPRFQTHHAWLIWIFFVLSTAFIHLVLMRVVDNPKKFIYYFMGITSIKLLAYLSIILIYALLKRSEALGFALFFLTMYFLYTGLEVFAWMKILKSNRSSSKPDL
jgi:hypothetical protein